MRLKNIFLAVAGVTVTVFSWHAQTVDEKFAAELKAKSADVRSIQCEFTQERAIAVLNDKILKEGDFYFRNTGDMLLAFDDGDHIVMADGWFESKTSGRVTATSIKSNPMLGNLSAILGACISGDMESLSEEFSLEISDASASEWEVVMLPKKKRASSKLQQIVLRFDKSTMSLNKLIFMERGSDYTEYRFSGKRFNIDIDDKLFTISKQ